MNSATRVFPNWIPFSDMQIVLKNFQNVTFILMSRFFFLLSYAGFCNLNKHAF